MGLAGFGLLWEEGAGGGFGVDGMAAGGWTWLPGGRRPDIEETDKGCGEGGGVFGLGLGFDASAEDVPPESLSDPDSRYVEVQGIRIHYKEVLPSSPGLGHHSSYGAQGGLCCDLNSSTDLSNALIDPEDPYSTGIVLIHGFGGGVFAWRHVMEALASQCQCRVLAFDRPAFGLTTRPTVTQEQRNCPISNPYSMGAQADLTLQLCAQLGLARVLIVAHGDACILALRAASEAAGESLGDYMPDDDRYYPHNPNGLEGTCQGTPHQSQLAQLASLDESSFSAGLARSSVAHHPQPANEAQFVPTAPTSLPSSHERSSSPPPPLVFSAVISAAAAAEAEIASSSFSNFSSMVHAGGGGGSEEGQPPSTMTSRLTTPRPSVTDLPPLPPGGPTDNHGPNLAPILTGAFKGGRLSHTNSLSSSGGTGHSLPPGLPSAPASLQPSPLRPTAGALTPHPQLSMTSSPSHPTLLHAAGGGGGGGGGRDQRKDSASDQRRDSATATTTHAMANGSFPLKRSHRRSLSLPMSQPPYLNPQPGSSGLRGTSLVSSHLHPPTILGLALLHPNLVGQGPTLSRLLARSKFGRSILRPLLRSEVGEVSNRRAWHHAERLTPEVLELYKSPLRVEGWDMALVETARLSKDQVQGDLGAYIEDAAPIPSLVLTAVHDVISTPAKAESLWQGLPRSQLSVLPDCGHLSHEEAPGLLLGQLVPFCSSVLDESRK